MRKHIAMLTGISLLAACQAEERGADGSGTPLGASDDAAMTNADQSDDILAKRSLDGMETAGADIDPADGKNDERNDDINFPAKTRYATYYLGSYAPEGQCAGSEQFLELDQAKITYGETQCQIKDMTKVGDAIRVNVNQCLAEGEKADDRSYTLNLPKMDVLKVSGAASGNLVRCGSDG